MYMHWYRYRQICMLTWNKQGSVYWYKNVNIYKSNYICRKIKMNKSIYRQVYLVILIYIYIYIYIALLHLSHSVSLLFILIIQYKSASTIYFNNTRLKMFRITISRIEWSHFSWQKQQNIFIWCLMKTVLFTTLELTVQWSIHLVDSV